MTWIFGDAYSRLCSDEFKHHRRMAFVRTGCHVTLSGTNDDMVEVLGLEEEFEIPAPGVPFVDDAYVRRFYSRHPGFVDGPNDAKGEDPDTSGSETDATEGAEDKEGASLMDEKGDEDAMNDFGDEDAMNVFFGVEDTLDEKGDEDALDEKGDEDANDEKGDEDMDDVFKMLDLEEPLT